MKPQSTYDLMNNPLPDVCKGYDWIGQSFKYCNACGKPYWEHTHVRVAHPLGLRATKVKLKSISREQARKTEKKWKNT